jgi:hypothetical protein
MRVLCSLGFAGCCALCFKVGVRYLFGHLIVDDEGMRIWPPGFGFSFRWDELERWKIAVVDPGGEGESVQLEMTLHSSWWRRRWDASFTENLEFNRLVSELRRHVPDRESSDMVEDLVEHWESAGRK